MKKMYMVVLLMFALQVSKAQAFNEWFRQRKTQIKYLVNQIAALQVYIEFAQKGYKIVDQGLQTISHIKNGDFNLHDDFFTALKNINPKIRNSAQVADIIALQVKIIQEQSKAVKKIKQGNRLTEREIDYLVRVYMRLLEKSADNIEQLITLITANNLELSDDERLGRIASLQEDMQDKYDFARWFSDQTDVLMLNRQREVNDSKRMQSLIIESMP